MSEPASEPASETTGAAEPAGLSAACTAWCDEWFDEAEALLWNPEGAFPELGPPRSLHLVPQTAWYALGLLARGDTDRAAAALDALCGLQYTEPGTPWSGSFARFLEWPAPQAGAIEWVDYDPNWRQFLGTTFALVARSWPAVAQGGVERALQLAVAGEPPERVVPSYANIALLKAWLEVEHGDRAAAEAYAEQVVARFDEHGAFDEYGSATYYGIDLFALALWRGHSSSPALREAGARLEAALWDDVGRWYHAGLRNLCGPWTRSYGMDLNGYLGLLGLWAWQAVGRDLAPLPHLGGPFEHSHDVSFGPMVEHVGAVVPAAAEAALRAFPGEHVVEQELPGGRRATGWLAEHVMAGGEEGVAFPARGQYHPATLHWRAPGGVGWVRVRSTDRLDAEASPGRLSVRCPPSSALTLLVSVPGGTPPLGGERWALPGLDLQVATDGTLHPAVATTGPPAKVRVEGASRLTLSPA